MAVLLFAMSAAAESAIATCVEQLHAANRQRQAWGELPAAATQTEAVKALGSRLQRDHIILDSAVMQYAGANDLVLKDEPLAPSPLSKLEGARFDAAWLSTVDRSNVEMTRIVDGCTRLTAEPQLRRLLNKAMATYREHQREVDRAYRELLPAT